MVEFCTACGTSLPKGDLTIKKGKVFTSIDFDCPSCHKPANPQGDETKPAVPEPDGEKDLVIKKGQAQAE